MKKEKEFIISSEELKKNQERVLKEEAEARRLEAAAKKEYQINIIVACITAIVLFILIALIFNSGSKGVEACVEAGNSINYCKAELLR